MSKLKYIFIIWLSLGSIYSQAQNYSAEKAIPFIKNYSPSDYNTHEQNFAITQDHKGIMYFANFAGILKFDGVNWFKISTSSGMRVLDLDTDSKGTVYASGLFDLGVLKNKNPDGSNDFTSYAKLINKTRRSENIFGTHCANNRTYFVSEQYLYIKNNKTIRSVKFENRAQSSFLINNKLYIFFKPNEQSTKSAPTGLCIYKNNKFEKIQNKSGVHIIDANFLFNVPQTDQLILGTSKQGFFSIENNRIETIDADVSQYAIKHSLNCGTAINDKYIALGTLTGGVVIADLSGEILKVIDNKSNLQNNAVNALYTDRDNALWVATDFGISKIDLTGNWSYFNNETTIINGRINKIGKYKKNILVASDKGMYILKDTKFERFNDFDIACHDYIIINQTVIAATTKGIKLIQDQNTGSSGVSEFTFCLEKSKKNSDTFYAGMTDKFSILRFHDKKIKKILTVNNISGDIINIKEDQNSTLIFLENSVGQVYVYNEIENTTRRLEPDSGVTALKILQSGESTFFSSDDGLFRYNPNTRNLNSFELVENNKKISWLGDILSLPEDNFLFTDGERKNIGMFIIKSQTIYKTPFIPFKNFSVKSLYFDKVYNNIWIGGTNTILMYKYGTERDYKSLFAPQLVQIKNLKKDTLIHFYPDSTYTQIFNFSANSKEFSFSSPHYPTEGEILYRTFLKGFDEDTTAWTADNKRRFTNLPDRKYRLFIETKNEFGNIIGNTDYAFEILTPVYRRWWAIAIYIAIIGAILKFFVDRRIKASEREKIALEKVVEERTAEIIKSKEEIETQRDYAYKQRKEIMDSINYARRIQRAVLPSDDAIDEILGEHFILFKPYEVVSGDFFWMKKIKNFTAVVAADCTGHGVPGAFMSMLGSSFFNELVTRRSMDSAADILNRLRSKIKKSLHQEGKDSDQKDGMDLSFYLFDSESYEVQFSGAYNPLYIIRHNSNFSEEDYKVIENDQSIKLYKDSEEKAEDFIKNHNYNYSIIELKANRQPIGIYIKERAFTSTHFQLKKGDTLYNFSDGYVDQFGGETGSKFKTKRFKQLLLSIQEKSMPEQQKILDQVFYAWKGSQNQIDDVIIIGNKV
ncbi:MAG: SpoIIE family protein phosphatase [Bacteroidota bacterium]|nr:SpoIIE family protein phosphatase [Bacteroidota bacterium]